MLEGIINNQETMPIASSATPEVWAIVERIAQLTTAMSPQNLTTSKMTEQPIVYSIVTGTKAQMADWLPRNAKNGKYADSCAAGPYDIIDLDREMVALRAVIERKYLNPAKTNFYLRKKEFIFASTDARHVVEECLPADIDEFRELIENGVEIKIEIPKNKCGHPTQKGNPCRREGIESDGKCSLHSEEVSEVDRIICGHPTKAGTPCRREPNNPGEKCTLHNGPNNGPAEICGYPTKAGTPCKRGVKTAGDKCTTHAKMGAPPSSALPRGSYTCGYPTKAGTPCSRRVSNPGDKCSTHARMDAPTTPPPTVVPTTPPPMSPSALPRGSYTCGFPTKAGTPCKRGVKTPGGKCATHAKMMTSAA